jgi:hypothetical protein
MELFAGIAQDAIHLGKVVGIKEELKLGPDYVIRSCRARL